MFDELLKAMRVEETEKTAEDTLVEDVAAADTFGRVAAYGYLEKMAEEMEVEEEELTEEKIAGIVSTLKKKFGPNISKALKEYGKGLRFKATGPVEGGAVKTLGKAFRKAHPGATRVYDKERMIRALKAYGATAGVGGLGIGGYKLIKND